MSAHHFKEFLLNYMSEEKANPKQKRIFASVITSKIKQNLQHKNQQFIILLQLNVLKQKIILFSNNQTLNKYSQLALPELHLFSQLSNDFLNKINELKFFATKSDCPKISNSCNILFGVDVVTKSKQISVLDLKQLEMNPISRARSARITI